MLEARVSVKEDEEPKLIAERFLSIADAQRIPFNDNAPYAGGRPKPQSAVAVSQSVQQTPKETCQKSALSGLFIKVPSKESEEYKKAMQFLAVFDGLTPLYIHFSDTKKTVKAPTKLWVDTVSGDNYVAKKLGEIIGEENVKMK